MSGRSQGNGKPVHPLTFRRYQVHFFKHFQNAGSAEHCGDPDRGGIQGIRQSLLRPDFAAERAVVVAGGIVAVTDRQIFQHGIGAEQAAGDRFREQKRFQRGSGGPDRDGRIDLSVARIIGRKGAGQCDNFACGVFQQNAGGIFYAWQGAAVTDQCLPQQPRCLGMVSTDDPVSCGSCFVRRQVEIHPVRRLGVKLEFRRNAELTETQRFLILNVQLFLFGDDPQMDQLAQHPVPAVQRNRAESVRPVDIRPLRQTAEQGAFRTVQIFCMLTEIVVCRRFDPENLSAERKPVEVFFQNPVFAVELFQPPRPDDLLKFSFQRPPGPGLRHACQLHGDG